MGISFRALRPEEVEVRVGACTEKGCSLLLYKTSRTDMALLDETVGPERWQCRYGSVDGKLFCSIGVKVGDEWVWKSDTGTESNMEAQKGEASDAFKRAGFKWGIGRELYTAPFIWVDASKCRIADGRNGRKQCRDDFRVTEMAVDGGAIVGLVIANMSRKGAVVYGRAGGGSGAPQDALEAARRRLWEAVKALAASEGREASAVMDDVKARPEWGAQHDSAEWLDAVASELEGAA